MAGDYTTGVAQSIATAMPPVGAQIPFEDSVRLAGLVRDHYKFAWRLLRRLGVAESDADDATQQVFMLMSAKLGTMDREAELPSIYQAARGVAANYRRKARRHRAGDAVAAVPEPRPGSDPEEQVQRLEARKLLDTLLARLPLALRVIYIFAEIESLAAPEIARILGLPVGTVTSRLRRARIAFANQLADMRASVLAEGVDR